MFNIVDLTDNRIDRGNAGSTGHALDAIGRLDTHRSQHVLDAGCKKV